MESFEKKSLEVFPEIVINKGFIHQAGFGSRAIPTYVREWIIAHYVGDDTELNENVREKIVKFVNAYVPIKGEKEVIKNELYEQMEVKFLDNLSVYVNLAKGDRYLFIPFLDENSAHVSPKIVQENEMLLSSGLWGLGTFFYVPPGEESAKGQVWMREFRPFQLARMDIEYFQECRRIFTTEEWINLIVSSMGFNYNIYSERQKVLLISRLIPLVEPRYNLVELAPKGTGKSFVYENMSRYVAVRSGSITPAVLFFNDARKTPGLITRNDCVVIDEAQKVKGDSSGELTALMKSYLEAGRFGRGSAGTISAEAGIVILANIELDQHKRPLREDIGLFKVFPNFLQETAFIDRFSGLLPGWELPRITKNTPSKSLGLKGDIFGEIMHSLRSDISYRDFVKTNMELSNCDDMRDNRGIEGGATGLLKMLFPDRQPSDDDFYKYCVNPALELRQRVRYELCKLDREYVSVSFSSKYPDEFQQHHRDPVFQTPTTGGQNEQVTNLDQASELSDVSIDEVTENAELMDVEQLILAGENDHLEFKSTLRLNLYTNRNDREIEQAVLKTIVAFLNSEGGTLLIGVEDNGNVLGIDADKFQNEDKFLLHFTNLVNDKIGKQYADHIRRNLQAVGEKKILRVDCLPNLTPVFLNIAGQDELYIRTGPSTVQLSAKEVLEYTRKHFRR